MKLFDFKCDGCGLKFEAFVVADDELIDRFSVHHQRKVHLEDRWDPKTGEKLDPIEVVDEEESDVIVWKGEETYLHELGDLIAEEVGCVVGVDGPMDGDPEILVFGPPIDVEVEGRDEGKIQTEGGLLWEEVRGLGPELERIAKELRALGLDPGKALVFPVMSIST